MQGNIIVYKNDLRMRNVINKWCQMNSRKRIKTKNVIITVKEKHCPLKKFANVKEKKTKMKP